MKATKGDQVLPTEPEVGQGAEQEPAGGKRRGQTLRLTDDAWAQLKHMSVDERKTAHDLLLEAVNLLFRDRGKPPIA